MAKGGKRKWGQRRGGRPRKPIEAAERKPGGKVRDRDNPGPTPEALAQRQVMLPRVKDPAVLTSVAAGSYIGRLWLRGLITEAQLKAGVRYRNTTHAMHQVIQAPVCRVKMPDEKRDPCYRDNDGRTDAENSLIIRGEYDESFAVLRECGHAVLVATNLGTQMQPEDEPALECLKVGLSALARAAKRIADAGVERVKRAVALGHIE